MNGNNDATESTNKPFLTATGVALSEARGVFAAQGDIAKRIGAVNQSSHSRRAALIPSSDTKKRPKERGIKVIKEEKHIEYFVETVFENIDTVMANYTVAGKVLDFIVKTAKETNVIVEGKLVKDVAVIPLQEMVDWEVYSDIEAARLGIERARGLLQGLSMGAKIKIQNKGRRFSRRAILFPTIDILGNECRVWFNTKVDWACFFEYTMVCPPYLFALRAKAYNLLNYLLSLVRIEPNGYREVSIETVRMHLGLPAIGQTNKTKRDIVDRIKDAVEKIRCEEELWREKHNEKMLDVEIITSGENAKDFLKGRIRLTLHGRMLETLKEIADARETAKRKQEERKEKAKQRALQKIYEKEMMEQEKKQLPV